MPQSPPKWPRERRKPREKTPPKPIDAARLNDMALAYVARFATSASKLEDYLRRKLRERGWAGDEDPPLPTLIAALVERLVTAGYVDDEAFARARSGSLLRRGFGQRRIAQELNAAGIAEPLRAAVRAGEGDERRAALSLARKRRFGPFGMALPDRPIREKQLSALLRAGHRLDSARELVNAPSIEAAEEWAAAADGDDPCE